MNVGVIGSRTFNDYDLMVKVLNKLKITKIISGGANGADKLSEKYAKDNNIEIIVFIPDWGKHGKSAGFIRNTTIVENSDIIVAFHDGKSKGTLDSINKSKERNKKLYIINF